MENTGRKTKRNMFKIGGGKMPDVGFGVTKLFMNTGL